MKELVFKPVEIQDRDIIYRYMSEFGEGSCQHSFVSMFSLSEKYGDSFDEKDDVLYTLRRNLCDDDYRVYLAPMGHGDRKEAFLNILSDAERYKKKVKFITLTEEYAEFLKNEFPDRFIIKEDRDLAEYVYSTEQMSAFSGSKLQERRREVRHFWSIYGDRASVKRITPSDLDEIWDFEKNWVIINASSHDREAIERESRMISRQISLFDELQLSGVVVRIDGSVRGFGYGTKLSDEYYDAIAEKGDRSIPGMYKILRMESVKQCAMECKYVNMEEDLGIEGLRAIKYIYNPLFLIRKYTAEER